MNRILSYSLRLIVLPLCCLLLFFGCTRAQQPSIAILSAGVDAGEYASVEESQLLSAAEEAELNAVALDTDPQELEQLIEDENLHALIICLSASQQAETYIEAARSSLTPIIFCGAAPDEETMLGYDQCWYIGSSPQSEGELLGQTLFECYKSGQIPDKNGDKLLQTLVVTKESTASDRIFSVLRIFENQGIYSDDPIVFCTEDASQDIAAALSETLLANPQTDLVLIEDSSVVDSVLPVCEEQGVGAALLGADAGTVQTEDTRLLACSGFDLEDAAKLIVTYAANAASGKDPADGTGERMSESRFTVLEPMILFQTQMSSEE